MTVIDGMGNRLTLDDICYCPASRDRILSFMKFRCEHAVDFRFTGLETFVLLAANGFEIHGKSVNDICHISLGSQSEINVAITRNAAVATRSSTKLPEIIETPQDDDSDHDIQLDDDSDPGIQIAGRGLKHQDDSSQLSCKPRELWHLRFGHTSTTVLRKLDLIKSTFDSRYCVPCLRAKKTRKPFPPSESKAESKLERVHSDICGPFYESHDHTIYNLLFIDEVTRWAHSIDIKDKTSSTLKEKFTEYIAEVERQTGLKIKKLHVDGGGEYKGHLTPILKAIGIKHEPTPPRTPECNGKAERMNRTLNNMVRAMLAQANMPNSFWAEAMKTATYLRNRLPNSAINDEIPYERWYGKPLKEADMKLLKPFGCIVWDQVPEKDRKKKRRNKLADHGTRGCFLGYVSSTTYLYWNFERKAAVQSHNLTFMETQFPERSDFDDQSDEAFRWPPLLPTTGALDESDDEEIYESDNDETLTPNLSTPAIATALPLTIYDEIVVQQPPLGTVFMAYGPLAESTPKSFQDAITRPDGKLWWEALCVEISAVIQNGT